jgi:hypothetical protein
VDKSEFSVRTIEEKMVTNVEHMIITWPKLTTTNKGLNLSIMWKMRLIIDDNQFELCAAEHYQ